VRRAAGEAAEAPLVEVWEATTAVTMAMGGMVVTTVAATVVGMAVVTRVAARAAATVGDKSEAVARGAVDTTEAAMAAVAQKVAHI
jgi:hypothetical protein